MVFDFSVCVKTKPLSSDVTPSTVNVPATSAELSVKDVRVVQLPSVVVNLPVVVVIGPVGESLAETVTVLVVVQVRRPQDSSAICVGDKVALRPLVIVNEAASAHPNSSEMNLKLPF